MKSTTNVFLEGLRTDLHPLSTSQKVLTDALNATMITYNGNEMMLQNDMGNTLILDYATGNIMGLNPGFIPIGMKEHGGIMYIASVDKNGNGEIGTIPSPIIRDVYKDKTTLNIDQPIPINHENPLLISNKLYPADKFIVNLRMSIVKGDIKGANILYKVSDLSPDNTNETPNVDPSDFILLRRVVDPSSTSGYTDIYTPLISYSPDFTDQKVWLLKNPDPYSVDLFSTKGVYKMSLLSSNTNGQKVEDSLTNCLVYGDSGDRSKYWFTHSNFISDIFPKDLLMATLNSDLKQFPSSNKPGELAIKLETESVGKFDILPRKDGLTVPITFKDSVNYTTYFPGFYYSTDSGLYIDKLSNIKIIDEGTDKDILNGTSSVEFKNYQLEGINNYDTIIENDESIEVWLGDHLPQTKTSDEENPNTFILSNIKSITNHTETNLRSSTKGMDESPHTGVITVNLGEKYNNWYRLELDYYDLYGEKQGMFTKRFNPYINDVFGTNLSVGGVEYADSITMGCEYTFKSKQETLYPDSPADWINYSMLQQLCIHATNFYYFPQIYLHRHGDSRFYSDPVTFYRKKANESDVYDGSEGTITYAYKGEKISNDANYAYLYLTLTYTDSVSIPSNSFGVKECTLGFGYENDDPNSKEFKKTNALDTFGENKLQLLIKSDTELDFIKTNIVSNLTNDQFTQFAFLFNGKNTQFSTDGLNGEYTSDSVMYLTMNESTSGRYVDTIPTPRKLSSDVSNSLTFTVDEDNCKLLSDGTYKAVVNVKNLYDGNFYRLTYGFPKDGGDENVFDDAKDYYYWTIGQEGCDNGILDNFRVRADVLYPSSVEVTRKYNQVSPSYKITPYFCLTGTNDVGKQVYVQRFGKANDTDTDIVYEHNFELYANGEPVNYYVEPSEISKSAIKSCTYTHEHPFLYYTLKLSYINTLQPGIYVLNIQRVPGVAKAALNTIFHLNAVLEIGIGNISKSFDAKTGWIIQPSYNEDITNERNIEVYSPIVILVPTKQEIKITTDKDFFRQNIGLYKIKTCSGGLEIQNLIALQLDMISSYCIYMSNLVKTALSLYSLDKIKEYNFMLKYGVFFKESYVFIDGLVDKGNIARIDVGDLYYQSYPFIPSDPSMLPISISPFDSNGSETIWNSYVMPKSVLNVPDDEYPLFVFSNPLSGQSFSTKPLPGNLRQPVEL